MKHARYALISAFTFVLLFLLVGCNHSKGACDITASYYEYNKINMYVDLSKDDIAIMDDRQKNYIFSQRLTC